jgi:hypothetical protein
MAKKKSTPKPSTTIPKSLEKHLQQQQEAAVTVSSLLLCIIGSMELEDQDPATSIQLSLRHIRKLVDVLDEALDSATVRRVIEVAS